jgi:hypothetical protein
LHPPSALQASHSSNVIVNFPTANSRQMVTQCWGPSSLSRRGSSSGEPITNVPEGITTIVGQAGHSLNSSPGFHVRGVIATSDGAIEFSRIDFHLPDRGRDWSGIEAPRCKFQDSNQSARFPHTLIVARTCGGNRSSMLMRRCVTPWSWAYRQNASSVGRLASMP